MLKKILIINSNQNISPLFNLFFELSNNDCSFSLPTTNPALLEKFRKENWPAKKIWLGPNKFNTLNSILLIVLLPIIYIMAFVYLLFFKFNRKINYIIYCSWNEKVIFTPIAKLLKIKNIWLECPGNNYSALNSIFKLLYKLCSHLAKIVTFTNLTKTQLKNSGFETNNITVIQLGIKLKLGQRQENIFNKIAQTEHDSRLRKFFSLGTAIELNQKEGIELLFQAVKKALTVIPNLQLIIIGDGAERKNLAWLAKKMEIDNLVWFVGEQAYLRKWLDNLDIFVFVNETLNLNDLHSIMQASAAGLPIITFHNIGVEEIVRDNKNGLLIEKNNSEALAQAIIKLRQNHHVRLQFGKNSIEIIDKNFSIDNMIIQFEKVFD